MKGINYGRFISVYQSQDGGYVLQHTLSSQCFIHCYRFDFLYRLFISEKSVFRLGLEENAVVKKKACVEPGVCLTTILLDPETRPKETDIHAFRMFWFSWNRCSHNSGEVGHIAIPEVP